MSTIKDFEEKDRIMELLAIKSAKSLSFVTISLYQQIEKYLEKLDKGLINENEFIEKVNVLINNNLAKIDKKNISEIVTLIQKEATKTSVLLSTALITSVANPELTKEVINNLANNIIQKNPFFTVEFTQYKQQMKDNILINVNDIIINKKTYSDALKQIGEVKDLNKDQIYSITRTMYRSVQTDTTKAVYQEMGVKKVRVSVVKDSRTTNICMKLDGLIFNIEDAPTFPLHYNCRSSLLPIFEDDKIFNNKTTSFFNLYKNNQNDRDLKRLKYVFR